MRNGNYYPIESKGIETSQFLDSKPQPQVPIGFIPMTGEGIDAQVDDLTFCNDINIETKEPKLKRLV